MLLLKFKQNGKNMEIIFNIYLFFKVIILIKTAKYISSFHFLHENVEELAGLSASS